MSTFTFTAKAERAVESTKDGKAVAYLTATGPVTGGISETGRLMPLSGMMYANATAASTTDTSEDVLMTYTMPAAAMASIGKTIRILVFGSCANSVDAKTVNVYFGATALTTTALAVTSTDNWVAEFAVTKTGASTQAFTGEGGAGATATDLASVTYFGTAAVTDTAEIVIKVTGTTADLTKAITATAMLVMADN